jgi:hypothetical protein
MADVKGHVWLDAVENNIQDSGDIGLVGFRVELFLSNGILVQFQETDPSGNYEFNNVPDGDYFIRIEKRAGLIPVMQNIGMSNVDSDISLNGISSTFTHTSGTESIIDAGFQSSLSVLAPNIVEICDGSPAVIELTPLMSGSNVNYSWEHDPSLNSNTATINVTQSKLYSVTITDEWNIPVIKSIEVDLRIGIGEEVCIILDPLTEGESPVFNLNISGTNPGPVIVQENAPSAFGGSREITFELLEGTSTSSVDIDYAKQSLSISNGNECRTKTLVCHNGANDGSILNIIDFDFIKLLDITIDHGVVNSTFLLRDINGNNASLATLIESQGFQNTFKEELYLEDFNNIASVDLEQVEEVCLEIVTLNTAIDLELKFTSFCSEDSCLPTASPDMTICDGEEVLIEAFAECTDNVIYEWGQGLGFGKSHTVNPSQQTTYTVTVHDQQGCSSTAQTTVMVATPPSFTLTTLATNICEGDSIEIGVSNATGATPFTYEWNNQANTESIMVAPHVDTTYQVTLTDANSCSHIESVDIVVSPAPDDIEINVTPSSCQIPTGTASVVITGGTGPFQYSWSNGSTGASLSNLPPGYLDLIITDANQCTFTELVFIASIDCAELGNYVWHDVNYNGIQDAGEPGIGGVEVILKDENQVHLDTSATNGSGFYLFSNLDPGNYFVQFGIPTDFNPTIPMAGAVDTLDSNMDPMTGMSDLISLAQGQKDPSIDAGFYQFAKMGDFVWHDKNINGIQDADELGIANVQLTLFDCNTDMQVAMAVTDDDGKYAFCDLIPGSYYVEVDSLEGYSLTAQGVGSASMDSDIDEADYTSGCVDLESGEIDSLTDAGFYKLGKLGNFVWIDDNFNGAQDPGESPLAGVQIKLFDCDTMLIDSMVSDADGFYSFCDLEPMDYMVHFESVDSLGYVISADTIDQALDSDINIDGFTECINISEGEIDSLTDAGYYVRTSLGNFVWFDENADGIQDPGEQGLEDIVVRLTDCNTGNTFLDTTDALGFYLFDDLLFGEYELHFEIPDGLSISLQNQGGDDEIDSDVDPLTAKIECFTIGNAASHLQFDAGVHGCTRIGDFVWFDLNQNDLKDNNENGINGVLIKLYRFQNNQWTFVSQTTSADRPVTNSDDGWYEFCVAPGEYYIEVEEIVGLNFVLGDKGSDDNIDSDITHAFGIGTSDSFILNALDHIENLDVGFFDPTQNISNGTINSSIQLDNKAIKLEWNSQNEKETDHFNILKKGPRDIEFNLIESVESLNEGSSNYEINDRTTHSGQYQYYIQMVDGLENQIIDEELLSVKQKPNSQLEIYPNPVRDMLYISLEGEIGDQITLNVVDAKGQKVSNPINLEIENTEVYNLSMDVEGLPSGFYHFRCTVNGDQLTRKFVKI